MSEDHTSQEALFKLLSDNFHHAPITRFVPQTMEHIAEGEVVIALHPDPRHHHGAGRVHGGIISLLMDNAGFFAAATRSRGNWVVTAELKVNLLDSVAGEVVRATGRVLRAGRHVIHAEMRAETDRKIIAAGLGTYTVLPRAFRAPTDSA